jgi:hydrogenase maturation protein HypF
MNDLAEQTTDTRSIRVRGLVQGVGFRPTVWRLAHDCGVNGDVRNDGDGVLIHACGLSSVLDRFVESLWDNSPPLARIDEIVQAPFDGIIAHDGFHIAQSDATQISTGIVPDAATCPDCLRELMDPADRRFHYPFTNCTHCGPRLSIVRGIPYDRASTSMAGFALCEDCRREYEDPADRRFHAQPNACAKCGPQVVLLDRDGGRVGSEDAIERSAALLAAGAIVAIKGLGGIHLACDAGNAASVALLRQRKHRDKKPLALMARDLEQVRDYCRVDAEEAAALTGPAAPIVILDALRPDLLPDAIAPGQRRWGFMLPYSPLHHLLMAGLGRPIVLTSGNLSDEPQCTDNAEALDRLKGIADAFLLHDRPIENRIDDSVVRRMGDRIQILRRGRGYAPGHIPLPPGFADHPPLLALGGELKNTFCLLKDGHAILSQHMGDLEDARTYADYQHNIALYRTLFDHAPSALAVDQHPEYLSSKLGHRWAAEEQLPLIEVQHHHAHIAACLADNAVGLDDGPAIGVALDGLGFGDDGTLWGGEILLADYLDCQRLAHLKPVAMPGGAQAMREPWRNTCAQLLAAFGDEASAQLDDATALKYLFDDKPIHTIRQMIAKGINAPLASSTGRLFDAVAAAVGLAPSRASYEGEAAMALESAIDAEGLQAASPYLFQVGTMSGRMVLDPKPCWEGLIGDLRQRVARGIIAARFHRGLAQALVAMAIDLAARTGVARVALSGGVFQNRILFDLVQDGLCDAGLQVLAHRQVPANDGGLALGQAAIAAARLIRQRY